MEYTREEALKKASCTGIVEGKIDTIIESKDGKFYGYRVAELIKAQSGASWDRYWTIWTSDQTHQVGEAVIVTGDVYFKYETYTGSDGLPKAKVVPNMNNPYFKAQFTNAPAAAAPVETTNTTTLPDESPF